jgi:uncharacterized protein (UPF0147 family)
LAVKKLKNQDLLVEIIQDENIGNEVRQVVEKRLDELKHPKDEKTKINIPLP